MARSPLFAALRRAARIARLARRPGQPGIDELAQAPRRGMTRSGFLRGSLAVGALAAIGAPGCGDRGATVAIVGAGIAGLHAAWVLKKAGIRAEVYEATERVGGRMMTSTGLLAPKLTTDIGGEFIDSDHEDLHLLAAELGIELYDSQAASETDLTPDTYFFDGAHHSEQQVLTEFAPLAARIAADYDGLGDVIDFEHDGGAGPLDRTPISLYLDQIGASGWIRKLLEVAYVTEYGLDADLQSSLNLIALIGTDTSTAFEIYGSSDERYLTRGGSQRFPDELARRMPDQLHLGERLVRLTERDGGFRLDLEILGGRTRSVDADHVILAVPFSVLREVDLTGVALPAVKKKAIAELGTGMNSKVLVGFDRRVWRDQGYAGYTYADTGFQVAWDNSRMQSPTAGGLTLYSGGAPALLVGDGTAESQAARLVPGLEGAYPGLGAAQNGNAARFHWPRYGLTKGSYAAYLTGQWTTIAGSEFPPVGRLHFAGDHTSTDFQGFMGGAAETGRRAAEAVLAMVQGA